VFHGLLKHYGEPKQRIAPVGTPPITRWVYPEFTVYFEHRQAIYSVRHPQQIVSPASC